MQVCTYEDRADHVIGVKLLALSLGRHCPQWRLFVYGLPTRPPHRDWFARQGNVTLVENAPAPLGGWAVKPWVLQHRLAQERGFRGPGLQGSGFQGVLWLDGDLIVMANLEALMDAPADTLVACADFFYAAHPGTAFRTAALGFPHARPLPVTVNSAVLRVTEAHHELLAAWGALTQREDFQSWQRRPLSERPPQFMTDQDLLTGLLGSPPFAQAPLRLLRPGRDIAHCVGSRGYTPSERLRNWLVSMGGASGGGVSGGGAGRSGVPPLIHALGPKPWLPERNFFAELSPYNAVAQAYRDQLDEPTDWMDPQRPAARALRWLALGNPHLMGLPTAILGSLRARWERRGISDL